MQEDVLQGLGAVSVVESTIEKEKPQERPAEGRPLDNAGDHRRKMDKAILRKEKDIMAMKDRLVQLRFDTSQPAEEMQRNVKNYVREIKRLEAGLQFLRTQAWEDFEQELDLNALGLAGSFAKKAAPAGPPPKVLISEPPDEELEKVYHGFMSLKMMRTKSTATLEDQTPTQRWQSLFRMFKEWRHQTTVAEARQILNKENRALREEQIAKCRAAILSLQNQKTLSKSDEVLLQQLRYKLRKLNSERS